MKIQILIPEFQRPISKAPVPSYYVDISSGVDYVKFGLSRLHNEWLTLGEALDFFDEAQSVFDYFRNCTAIYLSEA